MNILNLFNNIFGFPTDIDYISISYRNKAVLFTTAYTTFSVIKGYSQSDKSIE
jgi:hypothetical protein